MLPPRSDVEIIRELLQDLPAGAAWTPNTTPEPKDVFAPRAHRNVLDLSRTLVVGNRGTGKTFWSHVLWSRQGRGLVAEAYGLSELKRVEAVFGFQGSITDQNAPSAKVITAALDRGVEPQVFWQAVLLKAYGPVATTGLPQDFVGLSEWFAANPEQGERRIREADEARAETVLLVMFDALDTIADDWVSIRTRTEGLLRLAVVAKGLRNTRIKIFMRPDQFEDTALFRFPDATKLRAERVNLEWRFYDLYALMFFHIWKNTEGKEALRNIAGIHAQLFRKNGEQIQPILIMHEGVQRSLFKAIAGEWMGGDRKRGATYSWLIQHLSDAYGETTPRAFLTALRGAAQILPIRHDTAIDYRGITHGVGEASENRVDDLLQDYWWIDYIREPLSGLHTPITKEALFTAWKEANTASQIRAVAPLRGLLPVYLALRARIDELPRELAADISTDENALLMSLRLISVCEIRTNQKVNFPDIFRVAFKMKRRGGIPPRRNTQ
ncbi:hypothetical protein GS397_15695 [Sphingobium yanoikuyae]|uniref:Uncharacterized protein n=1 Tax=Sphingobium yanoikuyae TaxID=13690 RepID=A0A6P1GIT6_SPHYA|nr:hypothetical protein [Sphingobium yanoikuyae]QHD68348.1 hypothetical protein GS397_15695 [Sphingobium yanoikuyae]